MAHNNGSATTDAIGDLARALVETFRRDGLMIAVAESCTGGMIAAAITEIAGSSSVLDRGFVTYSNDAKQEMLGVAPALIENQGAVSEAVASAMAEGALENSNAHITVSVTGIAGPDGGSDIKPVGLVWFACAMEGTPVLATSHVFDNQSRRYIRQQATMFAMHLALQCAAAADEEGFDDFDDGDDDD